MFVESAAVQDGTAPFLTALTHIALLKELGLFSRTGSINIALLTEGGKVRILAAP